MSSLKASEKDAQNRQAKQLFFTHVRPFLPSKVENDSIFRSAYNPSQSAAYNRRNLIDDLLTACIDLDTEYRTKWRHLVDDSILLGDSALQLAEQAKDALEDWWQQPAQFCAPFVSLDDMNVKQWVSLMTSLQTETNQLEAKRPSKGDF